MSRDPICRDTFLSCRIAPAAARPTIGGHDGLLRFVEGENAWDDHQAFMLGNVLDGSSINTRLRPRLAKAMTLNLCPILVEALPIHVVSGGRDLSYTRHSRELVYVSRAPPNSLVPIPVWHLWRP